MKFGIREVTDIIFKTKVTNQQVGSTTYPNAYTPVMIVDSAKMSSVENTVSTVYAQGGRGNPRLLAWDGDRTATFKFEESIITTDGLAILTGSILNNNPAMATRQQHVFSVASGTSQASFAPNIPTSATLVAPDSSKLFNIISLDSTGDIVGVTQAITSSAGVGATITLSGSTYTVITNYGITNGASSFVLDFYVTSAGRQLQVEAGKFAGYYYIEANTLFRDMNGSDHPAQITIPKGKVKSNFTLTMSPTGDPSSFAFEVDCLPDYTNFVTDKKVLYTLDISNTTATESL